MKQLPKELKPEMVTAIIDSREQRPLDLSPLPTTTEALKTGDYSLQGFQHAIAIERKGEADLLSCMGSDRDRFMDQVNRLLTFPYRALLVESSWDRMEAGGWRYGVHPNSAVGTLMSVTARGLPVLMCDNRERAGRYVSRLLFYIARAEYRTMRRAFIDAEAVSK